MIAVDEFDRCLECGAPAPRDGRRICASCAVTWVRKSDGDTAEALRPAAGMVAAGKRGASATKLRERRDWN